MINFRFHIVSLTAVLLALGIGLVLGTTFLDDVTVEALRNRQTDLERGLDNAREREAEQQELLDSYAEESGALREQLGERVLAGQLTNVPVLVIAPRGVDEDLVDQTTAAIQQADANLLGTWWLTDRLMLDDDDEVSDLGDALDLSTDDVERLRSNLAGQLGDVLFAAADPASRDEAAAPAQGVVGSAGQQGPAEPVVVGRLHEQGFIDYEVPDSVDGDVVLLPSSGMRILVVSGQDAALQPGDALLPVLFDLASGGPVPAVAVEPTLRLSDNDADGEPDAAASLVVEIRGDEDLSERVSTVDDLERVGGLVATVLALIDADPSQPVIGHYGLGDGARVLPAPPEEGG